MTNEIQSYNSEQIHLIKQTICKGITDDEFKLFLHVCKHTGLDPFMRQIFPVKRWDSNLQRETMTIQTGIDGYRAVADRTGRYAPGRETTFTYDEKGQLISATAFVKKQTPDGTWHEVSATAFYEEYLQRNKKGEITSFWKKMGHIMLGKCSESLCLRRAFPSDLSGIYTREEMMQSEEVDVVQEIKTELLPNMKPYDDLCLEFGKDLVDEFVRAGCLHYKKSYDKMITEMLKNPDIFTKQFKNWNAKKAESQISENPA